MRLPSRAQLVMLGGLSLAALVILVGQWRAASPLTLRGRAMVQADMVDVAPRVAGFTAEVLVGDNAAVQAGDPLVRIDAREFVARVHRAQADLAAAEADLALARAREGVQAEMVVASDAGVVLTEAAVAFSEADADRYATLAGRNAGAEQQGQSSANVASGDVGSRDAAMAAAMSERTRMTTIAALIERAEASIDTARAALSLAEFDLASITVRAPFSGVVTDRKARVGAFAGQGRELLTLVPIEQAYIVASMPENLLSQVAVGMGVDVAVRAHPGRRLRGRVTGIGPGSYTAYSLLPFDNSTSSFHAPPQRIPVKILLTDDPAVRRDLLSVRMTVDLTFDDAGLAADRSE